MDDIRPDGHLTIIEFARICAVRESHVRTQLSDGKVPSVKLGHRRWIPESAVVAKFADLLASAWTQEATLRRLRENATAAGIELSPDAVLAESARLYLNAAHAEPSGMFAAEHEPAQSEPTHDRALVATGD